MLYLGHIWKQALGRLAAIAFTATTLALAWTGTAAAANETYQWTTTDKTEIRAQGGNFTNAVNFTKTSDTTYETPDTVVYQCGDQSKTAKLTITFTADELANATQPRGDLSDTSCDFDSAFVTAAGTDPATGQPTTPAQQSSCNQGSFSWVFCPVIDNISGWVSNIAKDALVPMLKVNTITPDSTPALYQVWTHMRDLADVLFILVFLVIIIGTMMGQDLGFFDAYTIRKIWPRFIVAVVLVQFSFQLSGLLVDIGNVLGVGVESLLRTVANPTSGGTDISNLIQNLITGAVGAVSGVGALAVLASWEAAVPLLVGLLISLLVVFLTLGARFLLIGILIAVSPLACVALVLPNTRKYFREWFEVLFKLILMYPIVIGVLSIAGMLNQIMPFSGDAAASGPAHVAANIMKPIIVIAAFLVIPAAFKFASAALNRVSNFLNTHAERGRGVLKNSDMWQRGKQKRDQRKNNLANNFMNTKAITSLEQSGRAGRLLAGAASGFVGLSLLNAPKTRNALEKNKSSLINAQAKELNDLKEASIGNMNDTLEWLTTTDSAKRAQLGRDLEHKAPNLKRIASTEAGRAAIIRKLADFGAISEKNLQQTAYAPKRHNILSTRYDISNEFGDLLGEAGKEFPSKPLVLARLVEDKTVAVTDAVGKEVYIRDSGGNLRTDSAGNYIQVELDRHAGDVDMTLAIAQASKINAGTFGDKIAADNFKVMSLADPTKSPELQQVGQDAAMAFAIGMDTSVLDHALDPNHRAFNSTPLAARVEWAKGIHYNAEMFAAYKPEVIEKTAAHLGTDESLARSLASAAGVPDFLLTRPSHELANIAADYLRGRTYDAARDASGAYSAPYTPPVLPRPVTPPPRTP